MKPAQSSKANPDGWKELAWNGIRFQTPADWQVARMGLRYLILVKADQPVFEIRWERLRGRFYPRVQLRRLKSRYGKSAGAGLVEVSLPPAWRNALTDFGVDGFGWRQAGQGGTGAILHCNRCRTASMIQFFEHSPPLSAAVAPRLLASLRDHSEDGESAWSIFGVRARIPTRFRLQRYRFDAGRFELAFRAGRQQLGLFRWAPAASLLPNGDLAGFAVDRFCLPPPVACHLKWRGHRALEWPSQAPQTKKPPWWRLSGPNHPYSWIRLWHLDIQNQILAVSFRGPGPIPTNQLNRICTHYEAA